MLMLDCGCWLESLSFIRGCSSGDNQPHGICLIIQAMGNSQLTFPTGNNVRDWMESAASICIVVTSRGPGNGGMHICARRS